MEYNELEIIQSCQKGNYDQFGLLYDNYIKKIYDYLFFRTFHKETAEDLTSIIFTKALENIHQYNKAKGSFSSWLYQIAKNTLIDNSRQKKSTEDLDSAQHVASKENVEREISSKMELEKVQEYLQTLSEEQRDVVVMRVWDGLSYKEMSEITGKSEAALKMSFSRTIEKMSGEILAVFILISLLK